MKLFALADYIDDGKLLRLKIHVGADSTAPESISILLPSCWTASDADMTPAKVSEKLTELADWIDRVDVGGR